MKRIIALVLMLTMLLSLCACTQNGNEASSQTESTEAASQTSGTDAAASTESSGKEPTGFIGVSGGGSEPVYSAKDTVVFRLNADVATVDPHRTSGTANERIVQTQLYEGLFNQDRYNDVTEYNLRLAESCEYIDAENTILQFKLRKGVKFHNGDEMTADDVVFSLDRAASTGFNNTLTGFWTKVEKVDDYTVNLYLSMPYAAINKILATPNCSIICKKFAEENADNLDRTECGTGPYTIGEWITGDSIRVEAFPDYWRGEAAIKHGKYVIITDNSSYLIALENGEVDLTNMTGVADISTIEENPELAMYYSGTGNSGSCILFNCGEGSIFADEKMRLAVAYAIDRQAIYENAFDSTGAISTNLMSATCAEFPKDFEALSKDIEKAKQLVIDAGYPNGVTISVPTIEASNYYKPAVVIQEQLAEIGITLELDVMPRASWNEKVITNSDFQITNWAVVPDFEDADAILYKFHSSSGVNFYNIKDPELDKLLEEGRLCEAGEERNAIYLKVLEMIRDKAYAVPFQKANRNISANAKLQGVKAFPESRYHMYDYWWAE